VQRGVAETDNQPDVIAVLAADHEAFREGFSQLRRTWEVRARRVRFEELARELARHETAEEEAVYPVLAQLGEEGKQVREAMLDEERFGNKLIAQALRISLFRPGSRHFRHLVEEIGDTVERHAAHEEELVFPLLRRTQDQAKLEMMAGWVKNAKELGPLRPHPHAPRNLAGLLASGPGVAVLDRIRDAGRRLLER
jgi:hemerythrin superfamily protein